MLQQSIWAPIQSWDHLDIYERIWKKKKHGHSFLNALSLFQRLLKIMYYFQVTLIFLGAFSCFIGITKPVLLYLIIGIINNWQIDCLLGYMAFGSTIAIF